MSKIYVGNLPFSADENAVRELFAQHGTVESVDVNPLVVVDGKPLAVDALVEVGA